jgi:lipid A ethanolaminephosphotransferase
MKITNLIRIYRLPGNFSQTKLVVLIAVYLVFIGNFTFAEKVTGIYPWGAENAGFLLSLWILLCAMLIFTMTLLRLLINTRVVVSVCIVLTVLGAYFTDQFGTVIDTVMIQNVMETDTAEAADLLNTGFLLQLFLLGGACK